jgi:hypothetical protein
MSGVSTFTEAVGDRICDRTAEGESFRIICRHEDMPALSTLCSSGWLQRGVEVTTGEMIDHWRLQVDAP